MTRTVTESETQLSMSPHTQASAVIDITRPYEQLATCQDCGLQRHLPDDWQAILSRTAPPDWDGTLRCRNGHEPTPMTITPIVNPAPPEPDGSYLVHLVMDSDPRRAVCTGDQWGGLPPQLPLWTALRLCKACHRLAMLGTA